MQRVVRLMETLPTPGSWVRRKDYTDPDDTLGHHITLTSTRFHTDNKSMCDERNDENEKLY